jgi:hypothetical protein
MLKNLKRYRSWIALGLIWVCVVVGYFKISPAPHKTLRCNDKLPTLSFEERLDGWYAVGCYGNDWQKLEYTERKLNPTMSKEIAWVHKIEFEKILDTTREEKVELERYPEESFEISNAGY